MAKSTSENFSEWTPNQRKLINWLAIPSDLREHRTHAEFAASIGVTERTVFNWKDLPGLKAEAAALSKNLLKGELPEVYGALVREAKAGSFQHIKLVLEVAGEHTDTVDVNVSDAREKLRAKLGGADEVAARRRAREAS